MSIQRKVVPQTAGVYLFRRGNKFLYIGKAANLKKRLSSYFRKGVGMKVEQLLKEATKLEWIETDSETEALLKEAELVKRYRPKYNYMWRDDKNYFYVGITKEEFPKVFITHQPEAGGSKLGATLVGPFTDGAALKTTLRLLRKTFPHCTCKKQHKRPCLNADLGRCPGYCCLVTPNGKTRITYRDEYGQNIAHIRAILGGKKKSLLPRLKNQMRKAAKNQEFEKAATLRDQIRGLENVFQHRETLASFRVPSQWGKIERTMGELLGVKKRITRVEGYDISNISGTDATGSMVVFIDGKPVISEYRKFRIKTVHKISDVDMLKEVIRRRLNHREWKQPNLVLIDGGKPQLNAALAALKSEIRNPKFEIPVVVALAKREEELYSRDRAPMRLDILPLPTALFLQRVRDESHRFAKAYHHKRRQIAFRQKKNRASFIAAR